MGRIRYPDCDCSLPLPCGDIEVTGVMYDERDLPELVVASGDVPWRLVCPTHDFWECQVEQEAKPNSHRSKKGIGKNPMEQLQDVGIESVDDLEAADPNEVEGIVDGVSTNEVSHWKTTAEARPPGQERWPLSTPFLLTDGASPSNGRALG